MSDLKSLLVEHQGAVTSDSEWRARMRLLQAMWATRADPDFQPGTYTSYPKKGNPVDLPLGSRFPEPVVEPDNRNFLMPEIGDVVRDTINDTSQRRVIVQPRIWLDMLSSQPMCFNMFAELKRDPDLATRVLRRLWPELVGQGTVSGVEFEWSPGRDCKDFLDNRSAFDVIFFLTWSENRNGFIGIETKYHETLGGTMDERG